ncbi:hypothetical protein FKW77_004682 [Venturia effusa]|uniref:SRP9 domain-containing protein n=1 Tax=Venturia effusa TaxID=50376 RepID=A0A517LNV6_9PEZI|nr:hypothetical protein FKW77_004682 [Venturia effusa]
MGHDLKTADEWLQQSSLLLKARPTSTRITTKYTIPNPSKARSRKRKARDDEAEPSTEAAADTPPEAQPSIATLTVKSYDPVSGVCLRYKTSRGWEVGRLVANLGRLGRHMAALPEVVEDTTASDTLKKEDNTGSRPHTPVPDGSRPPTDAKAGQGGGGKKKKKGKK